jgi:hypothetical protein
MGSRQLSKRSAVKGLAWSYLDRPSKRRALVRRAEAGREAGAAQ